MLQLYDRRYRLLNELGSGGMGTVYRAQDLLTGDIVALKQIRYDLDHLKLAAPNDTRQSHLALTSEFQTLASLRHPNIITVHDYDIDAKRRPYFTMDMLDAPQHITTKAASVDFDTRLGWLIQVVQAIIYLHQNQILHCDLKPDNLLVTSQHHVKVVDFGLAASQKQWKHGLGTLAYMAPELLHGEPCSVASDIYALGLVAYELFTGYFPYETESISILAYQILQPITVPAGVVPGTLAQVIERCLAKDPASRYTNARSLLEALCLAAQRPLPSEDFTIRASFLRAARYTGRTRELGQLRAALQDARLGEGSAWLIAGESGIGKSRLLDEIRTYALLDGFHVITGMATNMSGNPYATIGKALSALIPITPLDPVEAASLRTIVPNIEQILGIAVPDIPDLSAEQNQERLHNTIIAVLQRQTFPLLIMLDDLQWETESIPLIRQIAQLTTNREIVLIGSYRSDDGIDLRQQLPEMQLIPLGPLTHPEIRSLIKNMLGTTLLSEEVVSAVAEYAEGNVFFIVDLLETLAQQDGSLATIARMPLDKAYPLSPGVIEIAQRRLNRVPRRYHQAVYIAAVIGREIDLKLLEYLMSQIATDVQWLSYCTSSAILVRRGADWAFAHDKIRAGILDSLTPDTQRRLHRQVAEAIEAVFPQDNAYDLRLAHHWRFAGDVDKERVYLDRAVARLIEQGFTQRAQRLIEEGLARFPRDDLSTGRLLFLLARAVKMQGDPEQRSMLWGQQALQIAEAHHALVLQHSILGLLGSITRERGQVALAESYHRQALAIAEQLNDPEMTAKSLVNMAAIISWVVAQTTALTELINAQPVIGIVSMVVWLVLGARLWFSCAAGLLHYWLDLFPAIQRLYRHGAVLCIHRLHRSDHRLRPGFHCRTLRCRYRVRPVHQNRSHPLVVAYPVWIIGMGLALGLNLLVFQSTQLDLLISVAGIGLFTISTAATVQKIVKLEDELEPQLHDRIAIIGAMMLYTNFINLFLRLLQVYAKARK